MALRSKNFLYRRKDKTGVWIDYQDSDSWYPSNDNYYWNEVTQNLPAGGYWGSTTGLHTIAFTLREFVGRIYVEATLASDPQEEDWFPIKFTESCKYYMEFTDTRIYNSNTGALMTKHGVTGTFAESLTGNFTYLRVGIDRNYISHDPSDFQKRMAGKIEEIQINY
jgi:hypothetical protein